MTIRPVERTWLPDAPVSDSCWLLALLMFSQAEESEGPFRDFSWSIVGDEVWFKAVKPSGQHVIYERPLLIQ